MNTLIVVVTAVITLTPAVAIAGRDVADEMTMERARQRVIQQRVFEACLATAKAEASVKKCHELLQRESWQ